MSKEDEDIASFLERASTSSEFMNLFPILDFKIYNGSSFDILIERVEINVKSYKIDIEPSIEIGLTCSKNGDLCAQVYNYGWGNAHDFEFEIDLSSISDKLSLKKQKIDILRQSELVDRGFINTVFVLISANELNDKDVRSDIKILTPHEDQYGVPKGGVVALEAEWSYLDENGVKHRKTSNISRIQRGAYDWRLISFRNGRFLYIKYDPGVRYSLVHPSVSYHFIIHPHTAAESFSLSTALCIQAKKFDRVYIIFGSTRSAKIILEVVFHTSSGKKICQIVELELWNPRNSFFSINFETITKNNKDIMENFFSSYRSGQLYEISGSNLKDFLYQYRGKSNAYDVKKLKSEASLDWGY